MKTWKKYSFLGILVALPMLIFFFLYAFGKNYYHLETYHTQWLEELEIDGEKYIDTVKDLAQLPNKKIIDTLYHTIPDFTLTDQYGKEFSGNILDGKIYVADFFFTTCGNPTLCPRMSSELKRVQEVYKGENDIKIVSFTVDPQNDTPEVLKKYAQSYHALKGQWYFLTGNKADIYRLAFEAFKINALEEVETIKPDFLHATKFILVDRQGRIRGYYEGTNTEEVDRLITEIKILKSGNTL